MTQEIERDESPEFVSYRFILKKVWPIIVASAAVPTLGLVDTAVIGHFGNTTELAGLAVASLIFGFVYWSFGFLRMSTTAYVAQAEGAKDNEAVILVVLQSLSISLLLALLILLFQSPILSSCIWLLSPPAQVSEELSAYFAIRIWGAPATLAIFVFGGFLIGRGLSKQLLLLQIFMNGSNALLDIVLAGPLGMGIEGIALGTVLAEYATAVFASCLISKHYPWLGFVRRMTLTRFTSNLSALLGQNSDIFIRTLFLLSGFAFFTRIGGGFGEETLAANHILLQLVSFSAFFLDGYAHVLESLAGKAFGKRSQLALSIAFRKTSVLAAFTALLLAGVVIVFGQSFVSSLTNKQEIIALAIRYLPYTATYIFLSVAAFQLDGLYIGVAYGKAMRDCSIASTAIFICIWFLGLSSFGNSGLWLAFIIFVCVRALTLLIFLPKLKAKAMVET